MMSRSLPLIAAVLMLLGSGAQAQTQQKSAKRARPPTPVVVSEVRQVTELPRLTYTGFLEPVKKASLSPDIPGRVAAINFRAGDSVKAGQVLARLTNPSMKLDLGVLKARLAEENAVLADARQRLARARKLFKQNLASAEQYEDLQAAHRISEARLESAKAQYNQLKQRLDMMIIRAPISGEVVLDNLQIGQWVNSNTVIYEIYNYLEFELRVGIPAKFLNRIPGRQPVEISVPEIGKTLTGRIAAVVRHVSPNTGTFTLRIRVDNPSGNPLSGLTGQALIPIGRPGTMLAVPRDAVVRRGNISQVVVVREGKAQIVKVRVTGNMGDAVIVESDGLSPNEQVVVRGNERLAPGTPVRITGTL